MHHKVVTVIQKILHVLEFIISVLTLVVLIAMLGIQFYRMFTSPEYFASLDTYLHNILTIVVGLEFVRMLIDLTPANTLEVLIVAISRHIILNHNDPLGNVACVLCIAGLFAIRRFLIAREDLTIELSEVAEEEPQEEKEEIAVS